MVGNGFGEIAEKLRRSTVEVASGSRGQGSGIIVKPEGTIVTNAHVVHSPSPVVRLWDGASYPATIAAQDRENDLAVLRIPGAGLPAATLADSDALRVGELVIAIGNPLGFVGALTTGVVHGLGRVPGLGPRKWVQAAVQLAPGNSGGPLADSQGRVVGVNTMVVGGLGLAVPSNRVSRLVDGRSAKSPLGVTVRPVNIVTRGKQGLGLRVLEIARGSAAETASLRVDDILLGIEGQAMESLDDFKEGLEGSEERVVRLQFLRGHASHLRTTSIRLGPSLVAA